MSYAISYVPSAAKAIRKLDKSVARRLLEAIDGLATDPRPPGFIQLAGGRGEFRIRVGDYHDGGEFVGVSLPRSNQRTEPMAGQAKKGRVYKSPLAVLTGEVS